MKYFKFGRQIQGRIEVTLSDDVPATCGILSHGCTIDNRDFKNRVALVLFMAQWSGPDIAMGNRLIEYALRTGDDILIGIRCFNEQSDTALFFRGTKEIRSSPTTLFIADGTIVFEKHGLMESNVIEWNVSRLKKIWQSACPDRM